MQLKCDAKVSGGGHPRSDDFLKFKVDYTMLCFSERLCFLSAIHDWKKKNATAETWEAVRTTFLLLTGGTRD